MKDYYSILGLELDASAEVIKLTYRRLAREAHPDRVTHLGGAAVAEASQQMAEINEAYAVLANVQQRREYDRQFRLVQSGTVLEPVPGPVAAEPEVPVVTGSARFRRPGAQVTSSVVREFANHLRKNLLSNRRTFSWREKKSEGFDWMMEAGFWSANYFAASRGFTTADPAAAQKFTNYANLAVLRSTSFFRKSFFLLLLPFQRMSEPEKVSALCRRFSQEPLAGGRALIALLDVSHGRSLLCGPSVRDQRFEELLGHLRLGQ